MRPMCSRPSELQRVSTLFMVFLGELVPLVISPTSFEWTDVFVVANVTSGDGLPGVASEFQLKLAQQLTKLQWPQRSDLKHRWHEGRLVRNVGHLCQTAFRGLIQCSYIAFAATSTYHLASISGLLEATAHLQ